MKHNETCPACELEREIALATASCSAPRKRAERVDALRADLAKTRHICKNRRTRGQ